MITPHARESRRRPASLRARSGVIIATVFLIVNSVSYIVGDDTNAVQSIESEVELARLYLHFLTAAAAGIELKPEAQRQELMEALELDPDSAYLRVELAILHAEQKQYDQAIQMAEAAVSINPTDPRARDVLVSSGRCNRRCRCRDRGRGAAVSGGLRTT